MKILISVVLLTISFSSFADKFSVGCIRNGIKFDVCPDVIRHNGYRDNLTKIDRSLVTRESVDPCALQAQIKVMKENFAQNSKTHDIPLTELNNVIKRCVKKSDS